MENRYIAFDVETPNSRNDRMSAIGVCVIENGSIREEYYSLIDPETYFNRFNIELTGISPELVRGEPTFPELWRSLGPVFDSGLPVAHNAPFDMSVLAKCLRAYGIAWKPTVRYACTCQMGRRLMPGLPSHRLNVLCDALGLKLNHHHAGSDSRACGGILLHFLRAGVELAPFVRYYDMRRIRTVSGARV